MSWRTETAILLGIYALWNVPVVVFIAFDRLKTLPTEWKSGSISTDTVRGLLGVIGLVAIVLALGVLLAVSQ